MQEVLRVIGVADFIPTFEDETQALASFRPQGTLQTPERSKNPDSLTLMPRINSSLPTLPKRKADFIEPMDCAPVSKLPDGSQRLFEINLDGYRAIAVKADGRVNLFSRGTDRTGSPFLAATLGFPFWAKPD